MVLVMHSRERTKSSATGPLALLALPNSECLIHGERDTRVDLTPFFVPDRRVLLLYPGEDARCLTDVVADGDPRLITIIVPDGNWRQAARAARRLPGVERVERVGLPTGLASEWGLRQETKEGGLSTFEAIARALGILEGAEVENQMMAVFRTMVRETWETRGALHGGSGGGREPSLPEPRVALTILYEDAHLVAVNKPAGALVHRGWGDDAVPILQQLRDQVGQHVYPVHRLDRATSGVLLFAKSSEVARDVHALFAGRAVTKQYLALCRGHDPLLVRVDHPLAKEKGGEAKSAVTEFRLIGRSGRYGLFDVTPVTGRMHQIRRHMKHASHPIIGDVRYGKGEHNRIFREEYGFHRLGLHCRALGLTHPRTGQVLLISASLSADFAEVLDRLSIPWAVACV